MSKKKQKKENSERWLLTYSDLITLLMIFFVIMYSMSNVDSQKYDSLASSLNTSLSPSFSIIDGGSNNIGSGTNSASGNNNFLSSSSLNQEPSPSQEIENKLKTYLESHNLTTQVNLHIEPQGLILSLNETIFFESGKAEVQPKYKQNLLEICEILNTFDNNVVIEGYTDNVPISNSHFKSNWELAAVRAINVVHLFTDEGHIDPSKLSATSYGEYRPIASNDTAEGRSKNRRIDIVLLSSSFYEESISSNALKTSQQN